MQSLSKSQVHYDVPLLLQQMTALGMIEPPAKTRGSDDSSIMHGLNQAIEMLCEVSDTQRQLIDAAASEDSDTEVLNNGRIICLTSMNR